MPVKVTHGPPLRSAHHRKRMPCSGARWLLAGLPWTACAKQPRWLLGRGPARAQEVEALLEVGRAGAHSVVRERVPVQLLARRHSLRPPGAARSAHRASRACEEQGQSTVCGRTLACCRRARPAGDASDGGTACAGWGGWGASARTFKTCVMPSVFSTSVRDALS